MANQDKVVDIRWYRQRRQRRLATLEHVLLELVEMSDSVEQAADSLALTRRGATGSAQPVTIPWGEEGEGARVSTDPAVSSLVRLRHQLVETFAAVAEECDRADGGYDEVDRQGMCQGGRAE